VISIKFKRSTFMSLLIRQHSSSASMSASCLLRWEVVLFQIWSRQHLLRTLIHERKTRAIDRLKKTMIKRKFLRSNQESLSKNSFQRHRCFHTSRFLNSFVDARWWVLQCWFERDSKEQLLHKDKYFLIAIWKAYEIDYVYLQDDHSTWV